MEPILSIYQVYYREAEPCQAAKWLAVACPGGDWRLPLPLIVRNHNNVLVGGFTTLFLKKGSHSRRKKAQSIWTIMILTGDAAGWRLLAIAVG